MSSSNPSGQPNLAFLKDQAKRLLQAFKQADAAALSRFKSHHPRGADPLTKQEMNLSDAQLVIARENGFRSWPQLKHHIDAQNGTAAANLALEEALEAARTGDAKALDEVLAAHPELKNAASTHEENWSLLCLAAFAGHVDAVKTLIAHGADPKKDEPVHFAGQRGHRQVCKLLVEAGSIDDWVSGKNELAAWRAAMSFDAKALRELLAQHKDVVKAAGRHKRTLLHETASNGDVECSQALIEAGAAINAQDERGARPMDRAIDHRQEKMVQLLAKQGATCNVFAAIQFGLLDAVKAVADNSPEQLKARDRRGMSVLRLARQHNQRDIARFLISRGIEDEDGTTQKWIDGKIVEREDWSGVTFHNINFKGAVFNDLNMSDVAFQNINLSNATFFNMNFGNAQIDEAGITGLKIYGIDVLPLLMAEMEKRRKG